MQLHLTVLGCLLLASLQTIAEDKIYRTTDAQGNPVFSSIPTPHAEQIDLQPTNSADPVEVRPPAPIASGPEHRPDSSSAATLDDEYPQRVGGEEDWDVSSRETAGDRLRDRVKEGGNRPRVNPLPSRSAPARAGGGGRR